MKVAIIGGGFAGAALAYHLVRLAVGRPLELDLFEPRACLGAGLTYATQDPGHRVNVRAERMSLDPADPEDFARWFEGSEEARTDPDAQTPSGQVYPRRSTFGRYVDQRLHEAAEGAGVPLRHHPVTAGAILRREGGFLVSGEGARAEVDAVALCLGNPVAELPTVFRSVAARPGIIADPWAPGALAGIGAEDRVLILGTGLTMADVVVSLLRTGHHGPLVATSRRGLLPRLRADRPVQAYGAFDAGLPLRATIRALRQAVRAGGEAGQSWHGPLEAIRAQNGALWTAWSLDERRRFLRHLKPFWDVHRFQMAPQVEAVLADAMARGQLSIARGRVLSAAAEGGRVAVDLRPRGHAAGARREIVDAVVNCTGPSRDAVLRNPAMASLLAQGLVQADALQLGIDVDPACRLRGRDGLALPGLYAIGPPTRGSVGEVTGAAEIAEQALAAAQTILVSIPEQRPS